MSKSILVIDDSATMRQQLRVFLEANDFTILEANDGTAGLQVAAANEVDMILADVNMPRMNGIEMIGEIRKLAAHKSTPIFVLTTESSKTTMASAKSAGATAWIVKPFNPDVLLKGIRKVLSLP